MYSQIFGADVGDGVPYQHIPPVPNNNCCYGEYDSYISAVHCGYDTVSCGILQCVMQLLFLVILILAIILHEVAHGYAALLLGDQTAEQAGRLTLNPIPHVDFLGTIVVPGILILTGANILFGWAKPVPYNPYNLKGRYAEAIVAAAGPAVNIVTAVVFGLLFRFGGAVLPAWLLLLCGVIVPVNLFLAFFNLLPVPPLDGSRIVMTLLPYHLRVRLEQRLAVLTGGHNTVILILTLLVLSWFALDYVIALVRILTLFITGMDIIA